MSKLIEFQTYAWMDGKPELYTVRGYECEIPGYPYIKAYRGYYTLDKDKWPKKWYIVEANSHYLIGSGGSHKFEETMESALDYLKRYDCTELTYYQAIQASLMRVLKSVK